MGSISSTQWKKAYMLEFLANAQVVEVFTFSIAPQHTEFDYPQRINETKTFGGSIFDEYGNDTYSITLNGSTVNEEKKVIYRGLNRPPLFLSGTQEIAELQKIIKNWQNDIISSGLIFQKERFIEDELEDKINSKKIFLYDLSKMSVLQTAASTASRNYWRVFIKRLKTSQDKSNKFAINYTLELLAVEDSVEKKNSPFPKLTELVQNLQDKIDKISTIVSLTEGITQSISETFSTINTAIDEWNRRDVFQRLGMVAGGVDRIVGTNSIGIYNSAKNILSTISNFKTMCGEENEPESKKSKSQNTSVFLIQFDSNGGSAVASQRIEYCKTVIKPTNPTKENFAFDDWYSDEALLTKYDFSSEVTKSFSLYAKWTLARAKITYNSRNGSSVTPQYVEVGKKTTAPTAPTRNGYQFDVWCSDYACTLVFDFENTAINEDITLYARWTEICQITFNSNGGSAVASQTIKKGGLVVYPKTPTKENYTFAYWCTDSALQNVFDFSTAINEDLTLYACYVQVSNTVSFDSLGGSSVQNQQIEIGGFAQEPENPQKSGFDFVYWATDREGTNEFHFATNPIVANTTLYAKWTKKILLVVFNSNGSFVETQNIEYGKKAIFPQIPAKEGKTFLMWQKQTADGYEEFDFNTEITEDLTLYAKWFGSEE